VIAVKLVVKYHSHLLTPMLLTAPNPDWPMVPPRESPISNGQTRSFSGILLSRTPRGPCRPERRPSSFGVLVRRFWPTPPVYSRVYRVLILSAWRS